MILELAACGGPVFVCNLCDRPILDAADAVAVAVPSEDRPTRILHAHKGACHDALKKRPNLADLPAEELVRHVVQIARNSGITMEQLRMDLNR